MKKTCSIVGCGLPHDARGLCAIHYNRRKRKGIIDQTPLCPLPRIISCQEDGCERAHHARGRCKTHYSRLLRSGAIYASENPSCANDSSQGFAQQGC